MRRNYFGRRMLAAALVAAGGANYGCAPAVRTDPWTGEQTVENQVDGGEVVLEVAEKVLDGPLPGIFFKAARNAREKDRLQKQVDRANSAEAENRRLRALLAANGDSAKIRESLSDRDLVATLEDNPCFYLDYLGQGEDTAVHAIDRANSLRQLSDNWDIKFDNGIDGSKTKASNITRRSSLECDGLVLKMEYSWGSYANLGLIKVSESSVTRYAAWDEKESRFRTLECKNVRVAPKLGSNYSRTTSGTARYDTESRAFVFESSNKPEEIKSGG